MRSISKISKIDRHRNCSFCNEMRSRSELNFNLCVPCGLKENAKLACGSEDCQTAFKNHLLEYDAGSSLPHANFGQAQATKTHLDFGVTARRAKPTGSAHSSPPTANTHAHAHIHTDTYKRKYTEARSWLH